MTYMLEAQSQFTKWNSTRYFWRYAVIFVGYWFSPWLDRDDEYGPNW
jgi:hypothetical protein